jgi:hypothetical protein
MVYVKMNEAKLAKLKEERSKLIDAWRTANPRLKGSILTRIADIDDEIERYEPKSKMPKAGKFRKNNIQLLQN